MVGNGARLRSSIPNQITVARLASVPLLMFLVLWDSPLTRVLGVILFFLAAVSDAVDGYLARSFKQTSVFGKFADPIADKLLVVGALVCLLPFQPFGELGAVWVMIIIAREFLVTGLRILAISEGQVIHASLLGKVKTVSQIVLVHAVLVERAFRVGAWIDIAVNVALVLAVALTVVSGVEYFVRCRKLFA
jgi:CDP-diacylglycerol---glycerol-3-phosphate 3-phosphatidyltransferase